MSDTLRECVVRDELIAAESIFAENVDVESTDLAASRLSLRFPRLDQRPSVSVVVVLPDDYPAVPPVVQVTSLALPTDTLVHKLYSLCEAAPGDCVLFEWLAFVAEESQKLAEQAPRAKQADDVSAPARARDAGPEAPAAGSSTYPPCPVDIFHGDVVEVKKSKFQAHVCRIETFDDVKAVMDCLLGNSKVQSATHNMMAFRLSNPPMSDYDDDGEASAGRRMLHMLQMMDVRDVMVVVSRWFGGTLLGPSRFGIINNVAKDALNRFFP
jgi:hypothetical protein